MTDTEHGELLEVLKAHKGPVLLSGYESALYDDLLHDWHRIDTKSLTQLATARKEILWMNFEPMIQETLFDAEGGGR